MAATLLRRRRSGMYDVRVPPPPSAPPDFFAAVGVCGPLYRYAGEEYAATLAGDVCGDLDYFWLDGVPAQSWMAGEAEVSVDPGEAVMSVGPGLAYPVQHFELRLGPGDYDLPNTDTAATPAVYHGGFLWWVEKDTSGGVTFTLKRSRPDLSEATTVATGDVADPTSGGDLKWRGVGPVPAIAVGADAVVSEWQWTTGTPTSAPEGAVRIRFPLPAGAFESAALPTSGLTFDRGVGAPEGGFLTADGAEVLHSGGSTALGFTWSPDYYPAGSDPRQVDVERVSVGPGDVLALFGGLGGGRGFAVIPSGGPHEAAPPTDLYQLGPDPDESTPTIGFIGGGP